MIIAMGFAILITIGTILLSLPFASRSNVSAGFLEALFTATTSTCVTGLVIIDTYTQWSLFGQLVILALIQIGGLGFMTIITLFSFFLKRKIGLKERGLLRESVNTMYIGGIVRLTKKILIGTLIFESIGALLLSARFIPRMGVIEGIYNGIFHSVSAFCNAGLDLMGKFGQYSSLTTFSGDAVVCLTVIALVITGGIGFFVWDDISINKFHFRRYQLHTKIVLITTAFLIVGGSASFFIFEGGSTFSGMSFGDKIITSLFCAVTPRTAGFNTIDTAALSPASKLLTMIFMFIGGSPGSTAGGIKTTTFAVIIISLLSSLKNTSTEDVLRRRLESGALKKATAIASFNIILALTATILISATNAAQDLADVLFEVFSAIGTVGLSTGITTSLNVFAQAVIIALMYLGRIGTLSFAILFTEHGSPPKIMHPEEKINIG